MKTGNTRPCRIAIQAILFQTRSSLSISISQLENFQSTCMSYKGHCKKKQQQKKKHIPLKSSCCYIMQLNRRGYYKYLERVHY